MLRYQVPTEKKQTLFLVTKLYTMHAGLLTFQPNENDGINDPSNSKPRCSDNQEYHLDGNK